MKLNIKDNYGIAPNSLLNNNKISLKAKGLFVYIQSKPDAWSFSAERIMLFQRDGIDSVKSAIHELEEHGYLTREKIYNDGKWEQRYYLSIPPIVENPLVENPLVENPLVENPPTLVIKNIAIKNIVKKNIVDERFEKFWELYNKDIAKDKCYTEWKYINTIDKDKILNALPSYIDSTPDPQFRKNPFKYLKEKAWLDAIIIPLDKKKEEASPLFRPISTISVPNDY